MSSHTEIVSKTHKTMKRLLQAAILALSLQVSLPQIASAQMQFPLTAPQVHISSLAVSSWVQVMPGTNIRNADGSIAATVNTRYPVMFLALSKIAAGDDLWVEISVTVPGDLTEYVGYVHESRIHNHSTYPANPEKPWTTMTQEQILQVQEALGE